MAHTIKTVYVVHHSHTDIGYTDLQERILDEQSHYIHSVLDIMNRKENHAFRWNCETYFCVEHFLKQATESEKKSFFQYVKMGEIGISATYLNFNDLADTSIVRKRLAEMKALFSSHQIDVKTAIIADINGISMGCRDAMIDHGIEFLFTNIHTHHGMYPLYQNQNAYWWENEGGKRLLVWNGEHYNLGNALGLKPNRTKNFMTENYFGSEEEQNDAVRSLKTNLDAYLRSCEDQGYPYDFIISSVSGVFSDNAPPNTEILRTIEAYHRAYGQDVTIQMVSLQELYASIKEKIFDCPTLRGDLTDWWANGVGSTPYAVKHYKEAQRTYQLCLRLDPKACQKHPVEARNVENNMLLYAEHTWGHSATITNPYDTMVLNLDMRKNSYASKAHENASLMLVRISSELGDTLRYYNTNGRVTIHNTGHLSGPMKAEFYIETMVMSRAKIINSVTGDEIACQLSPHPRGVRISFVDTFQPKECKVYEYRELSSESNAVNTRKCYVGAERVRDIVNDYDPVSFRLPYEIENEWFKITYDLTNGITSFYHKKEQREMLGDGLARFFTPVYERTEIQTDAYEERRLLGRNIRGLHAKQYQGILTGVQCLECGPIFTLLKFTYALEGCASCSVLVKLYQDLPRIDFTLRTAKNLSEDIESIFMPLHLKLESGSFSYLEKGAEPFRPGIDQLPGTCMEYSMSDCGLVYQTKTGSILIGTPDVPLFYMGPLKHHPIQLCDGQPENNQREIYSWVMNNTWETNFKMDLSGYGEFCYSLFLSDQKDPHACFDELMDQALGTYALITE